MLYCRRLQRAQRLCPERRQQHGLRQLFVRLRHGCTVGREREGQLATLHQRRRPLRRCADAKGGSRPCLCRLLLRLVPPQCRTHEACTLDADRHRPRRHACLWFRRLRFQLHAGLYHPQERRLLPELRARAPRPEHLWRERRRQTGMPLARAAVRFPRRGDVQPGLSRVHHHGLVQAEVPRYGRRHQARGPLLHGAHPLAARRHGTDDGPRPQRDRTACGEVELPGVRHQRPLQLHRRARHPATRSVGQQGTARRPDG